MGQGRSAGRRLGLGARDAGGPSSTSNFTAAVLAAIDAIGTSAESERPREAAAPASS